MKKLIQTVLVSLFAVVFILFFIGCPNDDIWEADGVRQAEGLPQYDKKVRDEKIYSNAKIEDNFDDSSLIVILDNFTGGINKKHKESFFGDFKKEYVQDLTIIPKQLMKGHSGRFSR